jgi:hypothetical protein
MKQCPNCKNNLADFVPTCPFCGVNQAVVAGGPAQPAWTGPQEKNGKATGSLISGLLFFFWPISAVIAVVLGHLALSEIKKSAGRLAGHGMAVAGLVLGYIGIAFVPFILIIAAIAIPNLLRSRMAANEASSVGSLRTINTAAVTYASTYPRSGYPPSLESLGTKGAPTAEHADLIDGVLASGTKSGYKFVFTSDGQTPSTGYSVVAIPTQRGTSGQRSFFTDQSGVIRMSADGTANANSEPLQ